MYNTFCCNTSILLSSSIQMLPPRSINSANGKAFCSHHVELKSSISFEIILVASWKLMKFSSLNLGPLEINLRSLLFLIILESPVKIWPWSLSMKESLCNYTLQYLVTKKTININIRNNVIKVKHFISSRVSKLIN